MGTADIGTQSKNPPPSLFLDFSPAHLRSPSCRFRRRGSSKQQPVCVLCSSHLGAVARGFSPFLLNYSHAADSFDGCGAFGSPELGGGPLKLRRDGVRLLHALCPSVQVLHPPFILIPLSRPASRNFLRLQLLSTQSNSRRFGYIAIGCIRKCMLTELLPLKCVGTRPTVFRQNSSVSPSLLRLWYHP